MGEIEVKGYAEKKVSYDIIEIIIAFCNKSADVSRASENVLHECEKFLEIIEKDGVNINEIKIVEDSVDRNSYGEEITYDATRKIKIDIDFNMPMVNHIRQILLDEKMNAEFTSKYKLSNTAEIHEELMRMAMVDSKAKAETLAEVLNQRVVGIVTASKNGRETSVVNKMSRNGTLPIPSFLTKSDRLQADTTTESEEITVTWKVE